METQDKEYCNCRLPIRISYGPKECFKVARCAQCLMEVNPRSKTIDKAIESIDKFPSEPTRNEEILKAKINEIIDLLKANGDMQ